MLACGVKTKIYFVHDNFSVCQLQKKIKIKCKWEELNLKTLRNISYDIMLITLKDLMLEIGLVFIRYSPIVSALNDTPVLLMTL